ncbi:MAG: DUF4038 domain-containing protein [Myxococcales bacterium]|nr:MAG: DUF4038 domain-containing protein [Myxococcales bacterium]
MTLNHLPVALFFLLSLLGIACSSSKNSANLNDGGIDADAQTPIDANTADGGVGSGVFPLGVSANGRYVVDASGNPFLIHGEAAWSLIVQLNLTEAETYLQDRHSRGVTTLLVNLIESYFSDNPPNNANGDAPFTTPGDFTTPNEAYFAHADAVLALAADNGIAVMLFPSYLGYNGNSEGWFSVMSALTEQECTEYGHYVGSRYASYDNIIWMWGGDYTPPSNSVGEDCMKAIADAIVAADPNAPTSAHWAPETSSREKSRFADRIDYVGAYTYGYTLPFCRSKRDEQPTRPTFLLETRYENEAGESVVNIRRQQWWGMLGCGAGQISGNRPIWLFDSGYADEYDSPLSLYQQRLAALISARPWYDLEPTDTLVTSGEGSGSSEVAASLTADGTLALVYLPPDHNSGITVDLSLMSGSVTATWYDPTTDASVSAGSSLSGSQLFSHPGTNSEGQNDWLLELTTQP